MLYYPVSEFKGSEIRRYIKAYNTALYGDPEIVNDHTVFLYHRRLMVKTVCNTIEDALHYWGDYSMSTIILPDNMEVIPMLFFGKKDDNAILKPYRF